MTVDISDIPKTAEEARKNPQWQFVTETDHHIHAFVRGLHPHKDAWIKQCPPVPDPQNPHPLCTVYKCSLDPATNQRRQVIRFCNGSECSIIAWRNC